MINNLRRERRGTEGGRGQGEQEGVLTMVIFLFSKRSTVLKRSVVRRPRAEQALR